MYSFQNPNLQNPFHYYDSRGAHIYHPRSLPSKPTVEVFIPLFVSLVHTGYHGGQEQPSAFQGPPYQGQLSYRHPYQGKMSYGKLYQGKPYPGQPARPQDNPYRDNLQRSSVPLLLTLGSPLVN